MPKYNVYLGRVGEKQVLILNYFKYESSIIAWKEDFLLLLESQTVNLSAAKKLYSKNICIDNDIPCSQAKGSSWLMKTSPM